MVGRLRQRLWDVARIWDQVISDPVIGHCWNAHSIGSYGPGTAIRLHGGGCIGGALHAMVSGHARERYPDLPHVGTAVMGRWESAALVIRQVSLNDGLSLRSAEG